jgi:hypothetical protein
MNQGKGIFEGFKDASTLQTYTPPYYQLSGAAAGVYSLPLGVGTFTLGGQAVALKSTRILPAVVGTFTLSGQAVALKEGHRLANGVGAFTLGGQAVGLLRGAKVATAVGAFTLGGQAVTLKSGRVCSEEVGTFTLTGQDVTLTYVPVAGSFSLPCDVGAFTLSGQAITFVRGRIMAAAVGTFTLSGQAVTLERGYRLAIGAGAFALTGKDISFRYYHMVCGAGAFLMAGKDVALTRPMAKGGMRRRRPAVEPWRAPLEPAYRHLQLEGGRFILTEQSSRLRVARGAKRMPLKVGEFRMGCGQIEYQRGLDLRVLNEQAIIDLILADAA